MYSMHLTAWQRSRFAFKCCSGRPWYECIRHWAPNRINEKPFYAEALRLTISLSFADFMLHNVHLCCMRHHGLLLYGWKYSLWQRILFVWPVVMQRRLHAQFSTPTCLTFIHMHSYFHPSIHQKHPSKTCMLGTLGEVGPCGSTCSRSGLTLHSDIEISLYNSLYNDNKSCFTYFVFQWICCYCALTFSFEIEPINLLPPSFGLCRLMFPDSAADSFCMSQCKNSNCWRSRQARWGLRRQWCLNLWHKRELSSNDWRCNCSFSAFFPSSADSWPWILENPLLLSSICTALEIRVFFTQQLQGWRLIFNSLMPPLLWLAVWVHARTRKAAGCQMRTVIRPVSTGLWLQVQICLQGWTKLSMEKIIHAETTERREGEVGWLCYREPEPRQDKSLWVASRQAESRRINHFPGALRAKGDALI